MPACGAPRASIGGGALHGPPRAPQCWLRNTGCWRLVGETTLRATPKVAPHVDYQHDNGNTYRSFGGDAFLDAYNVTAQVGVVYRNGGGIATSIPRNTAFECGRTRRFRSWLI